MLASEQGERRFEPASLTKLMTAYLVFQALERGDIERSRMVTASKAALLAPGARMYLDERHPATIDQLLRGLIVQSGNDAAVALAETVAGSESRFVERMNAQAQRLGLTNTRFANASGKPEAQHYSTSHDMARLAAALIRDFPKDYRLFAEREFTFNGLTQPNRNRLLGRDPSVDGLKTGQTPAAGYCLVSSAKRGERRIIAVVMGAANDAARAAQSQRLLNLGLRALAPLPEQFQPTDDPARRPYVRLSDEGPGCVNVRRIGHHTRAEHAPGGELRGRARPHDDLVVRG
ncbi:MAG: D-alanyl-D-alanine carboxypeptidase, partial [Betaproteobacteria bacterium]|nr:D-alanyl-D-alanine carboxypeptidase [Betaproteobacteria bacterium]